MLFPITTTFDKKLGFGQKRIASGTAFGKKFTKPSPKSESCKDTLKKVTTIFNGCEKMSNDLLTFLNNLPYPEKDNPTVYTRIPVSTYRLFVLACIGHCADMEWTKNTILRGDWEDED